MYYPCRENKGADQLSSYCTADQSLCFRIGKIQVSRCVAQRKMIIEDSCHKFTIINKNEMNAFDQ